MAQHRFRNFLKSRRPDYDVDCGVRQPASAMLAPAAPRTFARTAGSPLPTTRVTNSVAADPYGLDLHPENTTIAALRVVPQPAQSVVDHRPDRPQQVTADPRHACAQSASGGPLGRHLPDYGSLRDFLNSLLGSMTAGTGSARRPCSTWSHSSSSSK